MAKTLITLLVVISVAEDLLASDFDEHLTNHNINSSDPGPLSFINNKNLLSLSELPLDQLLKVQRSLNELRQTNVVPNNQDENDLAEDVLESRMMNSETERIFTYHPLQKLKKEAFTGFEKFVRKTGHGAMENPWDSKPSKVQTFFQISITALAFLAFAGYLLCMIVQAIKNKGTMYSYYPNGAMNGGGFNTMNSLVNTGSIPLRKRRPVGRRRRNVLLSADNRNDTSLFDGQEEYAAPDSAEMYHVMIQCAEDYTKLYFIQ